MDKMDEETKVVCTSCNAELTEDETHHFVYGGNAYCVECFEEQFDTCTHCGVIIHQEDAIWIEGEDETLCSTCADSLTSFCMACGERFYNHSLCFDNDNNGLCRSCQDDYYLCTDCGQWVLCDDACINDAGDAYCETCFRERGQTQDIHDYGYKPSPIFYGGGTRLYLGVELEVDERQGDSEATQRVLDIMGGEDKVYLKTDGSLRSGFEIVSHPCTLDYHKNKMNWEATLEALADMGFRSHDTSTCGLHVHLSRAGFGLTDEEQDLNIMKLLYLVETHWNKVVKFTRRTEAALNDWAARYTAKEEVVEPIEVLEKAKRYGHGNRYHAVNLQNDETVEIRLFRGTLNYNTFIATLEFCEQLVRICLEHSIEEIQQLAWVDLVKDSPTELTSYLQERGLLKEEESLKCA